MPQLNSVVSNLNKQYDKYKLVRQSFFRSRDREKRDHHFEILLNKPREKKLSSEEEMEEFLVEICDFYEKYKKSGILGSEPELIKYIRQALYSIFEVNHSQPKSTRYGASFIQYDDPKPETDYSIRQLHGEIKGFLDSMKQDQSEGIPLRRL